MNPNTNELKSFMGEEIIQEPFMEIPLHLQDEAKKIIK